jgi:hypothetical protein
MTSEKQIEANHRNAQKNTGPKSPAGKRASRLNAFKHGMNSKDFIIPAGKSMEKVEEFEALLAALRRDLRPRGALQELLVVSIAIRQWRLRRVYRAELTGVVETKTGNDLQRAMIQIATRQEKPEQALPVFLPSEHIADKLMRYQRVLESSTTRLLTELHRLQQRQSPATIEKPIHRPACAPQGAGEGFGEGVNPTP